MLFRSRMDLHFYALMNTYDYEDALFRIDPNLKEFRDLKESMYISIPETVGILYEPGMN